MPTLHVTSRFELSPESLWELSSSPPQLVRSTPADLRLQVQPANLPLARGSRLIYTLRTRCRATWTARVTWFREGSGFACQQESGSFGLWSFQRQLKEISGGTLLADELHYRLEGVFLAPLVDLLWARKLATRLLVESHQLAGGLLRVPPREILCQWQG